METLIRRPLTAELDNPSSPVRQFLGKRFSSGLRDLQRRYREAAPSLVVPPVTQQEANPGTVGTAADWLLRFLLHPQPPLIIAARGAVLCGARAGMVTALTDIAESIGISSDAMKGTGEVGFIGPVRGNDADPEHLARTCWVLALLTEVYRNPINAIKGPLGRFRGYRPSTDDLLALTSSAALDQLTAFRHVFEVALLPKLSHRNGRWLLGPEFTGSTLLKADGDLIAAGLLLDLKTSAKKPSFGIQDAFQIIGYTLLDFDDIYQLTDLGIFSARYAYLATWKIDALLDELAGQHLRLAAARQEFHQLLLTYQDER